MVRASNATDASLDRMYRIGRPPAVATLAVFVMTLFIQRANRRDNLALHAKLDELLRVDEEARSELTLLDEQEPEVIARHRDEEVRKARA